MLEARDINLEELQNLHLVLSLEADWSPEDMQEFRRTLGKSMDMIDFVVLCSNIQAIRVNPGLSHTEKQRLIAARIGQGDFRQGHRRMGWDLFRYCVCKSVASEGVSHQALERLYEPRVA